MDLEGLRYDVQFRKGSENLVADYLSRSATDYNYEENNECEHFECKVYQVSEEESAFTRYLSDEQKNYIVISRAICDINKHSCIQTGQFKHYSQINIRFWVVVQRKKNCGT